MVILSSKGVIGGDVVEMINGFLVASGLIKIRGGEVLTLDFFRGEGFEQVCVSGG